MRGSGSGSEIILIRLTQSIWLPNWNWKLLLSNWLNLRLYWKLQLALKVLRGFNWGYTALTQHNRAAMVLELVIVLELDQILAILGQEVKLRSNACKWKVPLPHIALSMYWQQFKMTRGSNTKNKWSLTITCNQMIKSNKWMGQNPFIERIIAHRSVWFGCYRPS